MQELLKSVFFQFFKVNNRWWSLIFISEYLIINNHEFKIHILNSQNSYDMIFKYQNLWYLHVRQLKYVKDGLYLDIHMSSVIYVMWGALVGINCRIFSAGHSDTAWLSAQERHVSTSFSTYPRFQGQSLVVS